MSDLFLKCMVFKGMFSDELAVKISAVGGNASFFVPKEVVQGKIDGEGKVRVKVFRDGEISWAILPNEYQTALPVNDSDLMLA